jgi:hypothetical protein
VRHRAGRIAGLAREKGGPPLVGVAHGRGSKWKEEYTLISHDDRSFARNRDKSHRSRTYLLHRSSWYFRLRPKP